MKRCFDEYVYDEKLEGQVSLSLHRAVARFNGLSVPSSSACYWNPLSENFYIKETKLSKIRLHARYLLRVYFHDPYIFTRQDPIQSNLITSLCNVYSCIQLCFWHYVKRGNYFGGSYLCWLLYILSPSYYCWFLIHSRRSYYSFPYIVHSSHIHHV